MFIFDDIINLAVLNNIDRLRSTGLDIIVGQILVVLLFNDKHVFFVVFVNFLR